MDTYPSPQAVIAASFDNLNQHFDVSPVYQRLLPAELPIFATGDTEIDKEFSDLYCQSLAAELNLIIPHEEDGKLLDLRALSTQRDRYGFYMANISEERIKGNLQMIAATGMGISTLVHVANANILNYGRADTSANIHRPYPEGLAGYKRLPLLCNTPAGQITRYSDVIEYYDKHLVNHTPKNFEQRIEHWNALSQLGAAAFFIGAIVHLRISGGRHSEAGRMLAGGHLDGIFKDDLLGKVDTLAKLESVAARRGEIASDRHAKTAERFGMLSVAASMVAHRLVESNLSFLGAVTHYDLPLPERLTSLKRWDDLRKGIAEPALVSVVDASASLQEATDEEEASEVDPATAHALALSIEALKMEAAATAQAAAKLEAEWGIPSLTQYRKLKLEPVSHALQLGVTDALHEPVGEKLQEDFARQLVTLVRTAHNRLARHPIERVGDDLLSAAQSCRATMANWRNQNTRAGGLGITLPRYDILNIPHLLQQITSDTQWQALQIAIREYWPERQSIQVIQNMERLRTYIRQAEND